jgi:hypothetical protein
MTFVLSALFASFCFAEEVLPFTVPFDTKSFTGSVQFVSGSKGAVAFFRLDEKFAYFGIAVNTNGWVAFGLNDNSPSMPNADIFMCRSQQGSVGIADLYAPTLGMPVSICFACCC